MLLADVLHTHQAQLKLKSPQNKLNYVVTEPLSLSACWLTEVESLPASAPPFPFFLFAGTYAGTLKNYVSRERKHLLSGMELGACVVLQLRLLLPLSAIFHFPEFYLFHALFYYITIKSHLEN